MLNNQKHNNNINFLGHKRKSSCATSAKIVTAQLFVVIHAKSNDINCNYNLKENRAPKRKSKKDLSSLTSIKKILDNKKIESNSCPKAPHNTTQYLVRARNQSKKIKETSKQEIDPDFNLIKGNSFEEELLYFDESILTGGTMKGMLENSLSDNEETNDTVTSCFTDKEYFFCLKDTLNLNVGSLEFTTDSFR